MNDSLIIFGKAGRISSVRQEGCPVKYLYSSASGKFSKSPVSPAPFKGLIPRLKEQRNKFIVLPKEFLVWPK